MMPINMLVLFIPIGLQVLLPIGFLVWQWREREHSWLEWWLKTILIGSYLLGITLVTLWLLLPWYLAYSLPTQEIDICDSPFTIHHPLFTPTIDV